MNRGQVSFPYPTGKNLLVASALTQLGTGINTGPGNGAFKNTIVLFDFVAGTSKTWTVPMGVSKIRVFVVGGGGGPSTLHGGGYSETVLTVAPGQVYSYDVGHGGTSSFSSSASSFGGIIQATGGGDSGTPGVGSGGMINTSGGHGLLTAYAGGSSGHRFGNGGDAGNKCGGSWSVLIPSGTPDLVAVCNVDGWGLGLIPGQNYYGTGGTETGLAGLGGGGYTRTSTGSYTVIAGVGGGGPVSGGHGVVGIEVLA